MERLTFETSLNCLELVYHLLREGPRELDLSVDLLLAVHRQAIAVFQSESTLLRIYSPLKICGDIHGQYSDLLNIFQSCGWPYKERYLFLGDYVDRGNCSLEVITLLMACKVAFPTDFYLLRGNHEIPSVNFTYGFRSELRLRYPLDWKALYDSVNAVFAMMPLAAVVNEDILCLHGGLSPSLNSLQDIRRMKRPMMEPEGLAEDLLWSDPDESQKCDGFKKNSERGCAFIFGDDIVRKKCEQLGVRLIVRAHQAVEKGYKLLTNGRVITLFSAPSYDACYDNLGAVMKIDANGSYSFFSFRKAAQLKTAHRFSYLDRPHTELSNG